MWKKIESNESPKPKCGAGGLFGILKEWATSPDSLGSGGSKFSLCCMGVLAGFRDQDTNKSNGTLLDSPGKYISAATADRLVPAVGRIGREMRLISKVFYKYHNDETTRHESDKFRA